MQHALPDVSGPMCFGFAHSIRVKIALWLCCTQHESDEFEGQQQPALPA